MTKEKMDLQGLAHELDHASGGLNLHVEVLEDVKTNFMHIVEEMNNFDDSKDLRIYFRQWHRELRILSTLMYHTMEEAKDTRKNIKDLSQGMFEEIVKGENRE